MAQKFISAQEADTLVKGSWFDGYTDEVEVIEETTMKGDLDAAAREKKNKKTEYIIFKNGLTLDGDVKLGSDIHSIYVVVGDLTAKSIELGDAILVVTGKVFAHNYIFTPMNEGIFEVMGNQEPEKMIASIDTPIFLSYGNFTDSGRGFRIFKKEGAQMILVPQDKILKKFIDEDETIKYKEILSNLKKGASIIG